MKPTAPTDRTNLKTWTPEQLIYAAPFWVAKLEAQEKSDWELIKRTEDGTQLRLDAIKLRWKTLEQLKYWKLVLSDGITRVLPPSLRTFSRTAKPTPLGYLRRNSKVGNWDKAKGIWD